MMCIWCVYDVYICVYNVYICVYLCIYVYIMCIFPLTVPPDPCDPNPCTHGDCTGGDDGSYTCLCQGGWQGQHCDEGTIQYP